jgi:hypothetical protein
MTPPAGTIALRTSQGNAAPTDSVTAHEAAGHATSGIISVTTSNYRAAIHTGSMIQQLVASLLHTIIEAGTCGIAEYMTSDSFWCKFAQDKHDQR